MKYKTSELEGALLDAAVAKAEGWIRIGNDWRTPKNNQFSGHHRFAVADWIPSCIWNQGGPIIERERIGFEPQQAFDVARGGLSLVEGSWHAHGGEWALNGPTPLVAAMRTYVANKFGEEVELP